MSVHIDAGAYVSFIYKDHQPLRVIQLSEPYVGGDYLRGYDLYDERQYKAFLVDSVSSPQILREEAEAVPQWVAQHVMNTGKYPEDTVFLKYDGSNLTRLVVAGKIELKPPVPKISGWQHGVGLVFENGAKSALFRIRNRTDFHSSGNKTEYVLEFDGTIYNCPKQFIQAIQNKLGL